MIVWRTHNFVLMIKIVSCSTVRGKTKCLCAGKKKRYHVYLLTSSSAMERCFQPCCRCFAIFCNFIEWAKLCVSKARKENTAIYKAWMVCSIFEDMHGEYSNYTFLYEESPQDAGRARRRWLAQLNIKTGSKGERLAWLCTYLAIKPQFVRWGHAFTCSSAQDHSVFLKEKTRWSIYRDAGSILNWSWATEFVQQMKL